MKINTNMSAIRTLTSLSKANNTTAKVMERLSSGLRINSSADDAAGMAISKKLSTQVKGLEQANRNAMDGISMIQTAEGTLNEVHSMLQRMKELTVQASNGTYSAEDKESAINEINQLIEEMESMQQRSQFNKMNLLDGSYDKFSLHIGANKDQCMDINGDGINLANVLVNLTGVSMDRVQSGLTSPGAFNIPAGSEVSIDGQVVDFSSGDIKLKAGSVVSIKLKEDVNFAITQNGTTESVTVKAGEKLIFKVGNDVAGQQISAASLPIGDDTTMTTIKSGSLGKVSQSFLTFDNTSNPVARIDAAITETSLMRGRLGAYQNRLEHTTANLQVSEENMTSSLSRIQDADMAEEMAYYTQYNVISQAATAMLAQANQRPQQVLQLLNS